MIGAGVPSFVVVLVVVVLVMAVLVIAAVALRALTRIATALEQSDKRDRSS